MTIYEAQENTTYKVVLLKGDEKMNQFLQTLGLYPTTEVTLITKAGTNFILNIKDSRYAIDTKLAQQIEIE